MADNVQQMFPITPAIAVDGDFEKNPLLTDFNANEIGVILQTEYVDPRDNVRRTGFQMTYWNHKNIQYETVLFPNNNFATIDAFITYVFTVLADASKCLKKYTGLKKIDQWKPISGLPAMAVNQRMLMSRSYLPRTNETELYVDLGNTIQLNIYTVAGDQTIAGPYYYTGVLA